MGKRLTRIFEPEISLVLESLLNRELSIILKNNLTLHGKIKAINGDSILFYDLIFKKHSIAISTITEIITDYRSNY